MKFYYEDESRTIEIETDEDMFVLVDSEGVEVGEWESE